MQPYVVITGLYMHLHVAPTSGSSKVETGHVLTGHGDAEGIDVLTANDKELRIELKRRIGDKLHMSLMGASQADPVRYSSSGYKARHYNKRFGAEMGEPPPAGHSCVRESLAASSHCRSQDLMHWQM